MKSPLRPPLSLPDDASDAGQAAPDSSETYRTTTSYRSERPLSERRRRQLAEQEREAELARQAEAERVEPTDDLVMPDMAFGSDASPPTTYAEAPAPIAPAEPLAPRRPVASAPPPSGRHAYLIAGIASALWIGGVAAWAAYEFGSAGIQPDLLRLALYALIALAPAGLALMLAHAIRQGANLASETHRARGLAEALVAPTALAAQQTGQVLETLRHDIDLATIAAERSRSEMGLLREALALETGRLNEAAELAGRSARRLVEQLAAERTELESLGQQLDGQSAAVLNAVERQSRMIVDASDLAQTQLREAEAALAARASDLAAAAVEAQDAARLAADDLARQTLRLENAGSGVAEQIQSVEEGLGQQRAALVTAAYALRTDQEDFSAQVESQRAQLTAQLDAARTAADGLDDTSRRSSESMRDLVEAATDQFRALVDMSQREADGFDAATKVALDRFEALAADARESLVEESRRALEGLRAAADESRAMAEEAAGQAQVRVDRLAEALFDAAQKSDAAADSRIEGARRIVSETADLVDEAGRRAVERVESTLDRMNRALGQVDAAISDLDERAAALPEVAQQRADAIRRTVEDGLSALGEASRKAAEDTAALDAAFQERVRRNYDMLTEAVRLMGVVSGDGGGRRREPIPEAIEPPQRTRPARPDAAPAPASAPERDRDRGFGLRGRLRLEPTDEPTRPAQADRLDWSDLVASEPDALPLTDTVTPADAERLSERIAGSIRRMGVDPNALLPRSRIEEAAEALASSDPDRARQIVRRVAPAAVRSVSRRVLSDPDLRRDAERFVRGFSQNLADMARRQPGEILGSLSTDGGRAFMLLDAAIGDMS